MPKHDVDQVGVGLGKFNLFNRRLLSSRVSAFMLRDLLVDIYMYSPGFAHLERAKEGFPEEFQP